MPRVVAAVAVLVAATALTACGSGGGTASGGAGATDTAATDAAEAIGAGCDHAADPVEPAADLVALRDAVAAEAGLPEAEPYDRYVRRCDPVGATTALVPATWDDVVPRPVDPPRSSFTASPDLGARVDAEPVVGVGAGRFVGQPTAAAVVNQNNADGSLGAGTRSPRDGPSIAEDCRAVEPVAFTLDDGAYAGEAQPYVDCGGDARAWLVAVAFPNDGTHLQVEVIGQARTTADLDALVEALASATVAARHVPPRQLPPLPEVPA